MRPVQQNTTNVCANPTQHTTNVTSVIAGQRVNVFGQIVGEDGVSSAPRSSSAGAAPASPPSSSRSHPRRRLGRPRHQPQLGQRHQPRPGGGDRFFDEMVHNRWRTDRQVGRQRTAATPAAPGGTPDAESPTPGSPTTSSPSEVSTMLAPRSGATTRCTAAPASSIRCRRTAIGRSLSWRRPATNIEMVDPGPANQRTDFGHELRGTTRHWHDGAAHPAEQPAGDLARDHARRADGQRHAQHRGVDRLSDQDGAGGLAANRAAGIVGNPAAWNGVRFDCSTPRTLDLTTRSVGRRTPPPCRNLVDDRSVVLRLHEQPECGHRPAGGRPPRPHRRHVRELGQHQRDRRVRLLVGRHVHGPG